MNQFFAFLPIYPIQSFPHFVLKSVHYVRIPIAALHIDLFF